MKYPGVDSFLATQEIEGADIPVQDWGDEWLCMMMTIMIYTQLWTSSPGLPGCGSRGFCMNVLVSSESGEDYLITVALSGDLEHVDTSHPSVDSVGHKVA